MQSAVRSWRVLAIIAAAGLSAGCTQEGCGMELVWSADVPESVTYDDLRGLSVRTCRNGLCVDASLETLPTVEPLSGPPFDAGTFISIRVYEADGRHVVEVSWGVPDPMNGDRYSIEIGASGADPVFGLAEQAVEYEPYRPNGDLAEPLCHRVRLEGSTLGAP